MHHAPPYSGINACCCSMPCSSSKYTFVRISLPQNPAKVGLCLLFEGHIKIKWMHFIMNGRGANAGSGLNSGYCRGLSTDPTNALNKCGLWAPSISKRQTALASRLTSKATRTRTSICPWMVAEGSRLEPKPASRAIHDHPSLWEPSQQCDRAHGAAVSPQMLLVRPLFELRGAPARALKAAAALKKKREHQKEWMRHYIRQQLGQTADAAVLMVHQHQTCAFVFLQQHLRSGRSQNQHATCLQ